ncbi:MAG: Cys-rich protein [Leptospiraceae bacterium]|nr:Cys-rich protein [Leptospiraceae bacterium]
MKRTKRFLPLVAFAVFCAGLAASNHVSSIGAPSGMTEPEAAAMCSSTCSTFTACAAPQLPPNLSKATFESGCYSGCMKHADTIGACVRSGASSCEEIMDCSLQKHFQRERR